MKAVKSGPQEWKGKMEKVSGEEKGLKRQKGRLCSLYLVWIMAINAYVPKLFVTGK